MKKIITFFTLVASMAVNSAFAEESYIYWLVEVNDSSLSWDSVLLYAQQSGNATAVDFTNGDNSYGHGDYATSDITDYVGSGWSYYVELLNDEKKAVAKSSSLAYSDLFKDGSIRSQSGLTGVKSATFTIEAVPEPTTGVMLLMGLALVGLRRKRA